MDEQPGVSSSFPDQSLPKISDLVNEAILQLKERMGSTVEEIYHHLSKKYKVDPIKTQQHIRSYLKRAIMKGAVQQVGADGASARFKLTPAAKSEMVKAARDAAAKAKGTPSTLPSRVSRAQKEVALTPNGSSRASVAAKNTTMAALKRAAPLQTDGISKRKKTVAQGTLVPHDGRSLNPVPGELRSSAAGGIKTNLVKKESPALKLGVRKSSKASKPVL